MSLNDKIQQAIDVLEIEALLVEGETYKNASSATKGRWRRTAKRRAKELLDEAHNAACETLEPHPSVTATES